MNIETMKSWYNYNIQVPLSNINIKSGLYRLILIIIIAYTIASIIGIFKIHINYSI